MNLQFLKNGNPKELFLRFISLVLIATMGLVLLNVMSLNKDGRKQIIDRDGGTEYVSGNNETTAATREELRLAEVLGQIKGVGSTEVMITYADESETVPTFSTGRSNQKSQVKGVIVAAAGAGSPVVKNDIISAVTAVFHIPTGNVMVFEKQ